ncbi:hypothetical protein BsWGS_23299 [Bradybaena similaris]
MTRGMYFGIYLCGILAMTLADSTCIYKECDCEGTIILCRELGLTKIPQVGTVQSEYQYLDLDINLITSLPAGSCPTNLQEISLMYNPITTIDDSAFDDCANTLQSLTFSDALFTRIPDAFSHFKRLTSLNIYRTQIQDWNSQAMSSLGHTLQTLDLDNCGMTNWPNWIKNYTNLTELSLSGNFLSSVPDDALDSLSNSLTTLVLQNNSLTSVPKTLSKFTALTLLYLQQNKISDVSWLPSGSKLTFLSLNHNNIFDHIQLSNALRPYSKTLNHLDIKNNHLTAIPDVGFLELMSSLDFSSNRISDSLGGSVPAGINSLDLESNAFRLIPKVLWAVQAVTYMLLSSNRIIDLGEMSIPPWIYGADLGNNLVVEITDSNFPKNSSLQMLHLNNNPIVRISDNAFKNLPRIYFLDLQNTKLTRMPLGLASAVGLNNLDLAGSSSLVCTCLEKSLAQWIMSIPDGNVNGDCGQTSIVTFYRDLSPLCSK